MKVGMFPANEETKKEAKKFYLKCPWDNIQNFNMD